MAQGGEQGKPGGKEFNNPKEMVNEATGDVQYAETHEEMKSLQDQGYVVVGGEGDTDDPEATPKN